MSEPLIACKYKPCPLTTRPSAKGSISLIGKLAGRTNDRPLACFHVDKNNLCQSAPQGPKVFSVTSREPSCPSAEASVKPKPPPYAVCPSTKSNLRWSRIRLPLKFRQRKGLNQFNLTPALSSFCLSCLDKPAAPKPSRRTATSTPRAAACISAVIQRSIK